MQKASLIFLSFLLIFTVIYSNSWAMISSDCDKSSHGTTRRTGSGPQKKRTARQVIREGKSDLKNANLSSRHQAEICHAIGSSYLDLARQNQRKAIKGSSPSNPDLNNKNLYFAHASRYFRQALLITEWAGNERLRTYVGLMKSMTTLNEIINSEDELLQDSLLDSCDPSQLIRIGREFQAKGDSIRTVAFYSKAAALTNDNQQKALALCLKALIYRSKFKEVDNYAELLEEAYALEGVSYDLRFVLACRICDILINQRKYDSAGEWLAQVEENARHLQSRKPLKNVRDLLPPTIIDTKTGKGQKRFINFECESLRGRLNRR